MLMSCFHWTIRREIRRLLACGNVKLVTLSLIFFLFFPPLLHPKEGKTHACRAGYTNWTFNLRFSLTLSRHFHFGLTCLYLKILPTPTKNHSVVVSLLITYSIVPASLGTCSHSLFSRTEWAEKSTKKVKRETNSYWVETDFLLLKYNLFQE